MPLSVAWILINRSEKFEVHLRIQFFGKLYLWGLCHGNLKVLVHCFFSVVHLKLFSTTHMGSAWFCTWIWWPCNRQHNTHGILFLNGCIRKIIWGFQPSRRVIWSLHISSCRLLYTNMKYVMDLCLLIYTCEFWVTAIYTSCHCQKC